LKLERNDAGERNKVSGWAYGPLMFRLRCLHAHITDRLLSFTHNKCKIVMEIIC